MTGAEESSHETQLRWEQGSLLPDGLGVVPLQWVHPDNPASRVAKGAVTAARRDGHGSAPFPVPGPSKQGDRMIVTTQSCDLVKPAAELPQIEVARMFTTANAMILAQAHDFGSARYFRVDGRTGGDAQILDYGQRALLDKGFLGVVHPDNGLVEELSEDRRRMLARWLGQRYARPAIPDADYEQITRPIRNAWKQILEEEPEAAQRFNREYAEWRYRREPDRSLTVYILSSAEAPDDIVALEVTDFLTQALLAYPAPVRVATDKRSYHTFTKVDELTTEQISMEWASHEEDTDESAHPG
ncbi:MAG: hypothetical protein QOK16_608 [Solirubrobacteraceae bacterium]|jgi:hypothetical protein|nr:hypothetical protein [Solirubrobacteraceae bacterium]